ncbi:class I SAM-dependent methyltransferase [Saccharomonospora saliphila]|uniref:class I SAM-dependent methyltransferase n=1 Tax=Saccharomonospora saliphila TaxID=369829 RepID=UPI00036C87CC|nr:class I SAM-dependent methyltransferase [Saccharomonospora saliphila]
MTNLLKKAYDATWGKYVFAGMYDKFLSRVEKYGLSEKRAEMLRPAYGKTVEIGTGTGLNLPHFPDTISELILTEPYPHMVTKLEEKVRDHPRRIQVTVAGAERLPFPDASIDTVAAAMILCTVPDPDVALAEIQRVLKPGGQYLFLEHVRNSDPRIAKKQDIIQKGWYLFGNECHCNRPTIETLRSSSLEIKELKEDKMPGAWEFIEAMVIGRAVRPETDAPLASVSASTGAGSDCQDPNCS